MKLIKRIALAVCGWVAAGSALAAEPFAITLPPDAALKQPGLSRAEVLADQRIWHLSGLEELTRPESADWWSPEYRKAELRYQAIRKSDDFQALVKRLQQDPNTRVVTAR